jgi:hypothetical protein
MRRGVDMSTRTAEAQVDASRCRYVYTHRGSTRYEVTLERSLYRALHELQRLQAARAGQPVPLPEAVDVDVFVSEPDEAEESVPLGGAQRFSAYVNYLTHPGRLIDLYSGTVPRSAAGCLDAPTRIGRRHRFS